MSSFLYGLGRAAFRRRGVALLSWLAALVVMVGLAAGIGSKFEDGFSLPGTESQTALDALNRNFPQAAGLTAQVIMVAPPGESVRASGTRTAIGDATKRYEQIAHVEDATSPFDKYAKGVIAADNSAAIISLRLETVNGLVPQATYDALDAETARMQAAVPDSQASIGGEAYNKNVPGFSITEGLGVLVALVVLFLTLGSLRAAGMPLLTALLGVAITVTGIFAATGLAEVSSTTPLLAVMLGLAVGIDYALFITSRHRDQLKAGMDVEESVAQSVATAGSAVVFAGLTVMIALVGLSVAGIPFLTTMGIAAAAGVAVAVLIALTLLPALLGFAGEKLRPRVRPTQSRATRTKGKRHALRQAQGTQEAAAPKPNPWVRIVTKVPVLTIVLVVGVLGVLAYPAKDLKLALPDNGQADPGTPARVTYDLVSEHFGIGANGPLIVSAVIVGNNDPLKLMDDLADELRALPGVASVPIATPNEDASFGIVQVIPKTGPDTDQTKALVRQIRDLQPEFEQRYGVTTSVTGYTAVAIDISDRLGSALLPFGVIVVGLSLLLLTMVFRSIAVPIKATVGYLLSVVAAFGATAVVFEWGWFSSVFNVTQTAPVISFLPILLMGILFGLAMDYEVFLVSRMREDYVHAAARSAGDRRGKAEAARSAIFSGFTASARVVVAAAVIMFAVFAAFIREGDGPIKTISFGLAVGVFIDAFLVRMTLVPAVMALLGRRAWWLPRWIDRRLPSFDVEGEGLAHQVSLAEWPTPGDVRPVVADGLVLPDRPDGVAVAVADGEVLVVEGGAAPTRSALLLTLAGRMRIEAGRAKVAGLVLPEQAAGVRGRTGYVDGRAVADLRADLREIRRGRPSVIFVDHADVIEDLDARAALASLLDETNGAVSSPSTAPYAVVLGTRERHELDDVLPAHYRYLSVDPAARPAVSV